MNCQPVFLILRDFIVIPLRITDDILHIIGQHRKGPVPQPQLIVMISPVPLL